MNFEKLTSTIEQTHLHFQQQAVKAVNISLTIRNWLIGFYIVEFEQNGDDRAQYGVKLVDTLAIKLNHKGLGERNLKLFRQFYLSYKELHFIIQDIIASFTTNPIMQLSTAQLNSFNNDIQIRQSATDEFDKAVYNLKYITNLVTKISFTHFAELIKIEDKTKRTFFELLILKTTPSVQELKRQINTLAYERVGLSANQELANEELLKKIEPELRAWK